MRAMIMQKPKQALQYVLDAPLPIPNDHQVLIKVHACGLCRTDLHIVDGELTEPTLPLIPGHQIVGTITEMGKEVKGFTPGQRIGVPWLGGSCGSCAYCQTERENLCDHAQLTGYQLNGGLADFCVANARFCFPIPDGYPDEQAAPLLCAGLIGYRAFCKTGHAKKLGIYGFGAAGHLLLQVACFQGRDVYAFTRKGDEKTQQFARDLGAVWVGHSEERPPELLDAAIIFAPAGELVPLALAAVVKGGIVVCGGIHMSDIPSFPYALLWGERLLCSVANLTRQDGEAFLALAPKIPIKTEVHVYPLDKTNEALADLRSGRFTGEYVIKL
jgi:alcohol dehydrogenase, propanol-preferring